MRNGRTSPLLRGLTGLAAALVLAACGVPTSGVIQAGDPATGMSPGLNVYFLAGGDLVAVPRTTGRDPDLTTALRLLFYGPDDLEAAKLRTELPRLSNPPEVLFKGGTVVVRLPPGIPRLSPLAMRQLACTVAGAPGRSPVVPTRPGAAGSGASGSGAARAPVPTSEPGLSPPQPVNGGVLITGDGWAAEQEAEPCPPPG